MLRPDRFIASSLKVAALMTCERAWIRTSLLLIGAFLIVLVTREFAISDNGDFGRYALHCYFEHPVGIANWPDSQSTDFWKRFFLSPNIYWIATEHPNCTDSWLSSAHMFWSVGSYMNTALFNATILNLRIVALPLFILHCGFFVAAARYCSVSCIGAIGAVAILLFFSDAAILSFYTSFYAEGAAIVAVFGLTALLIYCANAEPGDSKREAFTYVALAAAGCVIGLAKPQYAPILPLTAIIIAVMAVSAERRASVVIAVSIGLAILIAATTTAFINRQHIEPELNAYHSLYNGLLHFSADQGAMLRRLHLPEESASFIGINAYTAETSRFIKNQHNLSQSLFVQGIFFDPAAWAQLLLNNAREMGTRIATLGRVPGVYAAPPIYLANSQRLSGLRLLFVAVVSLVPIYLFARTLARTERRAIRAVVTLLVAIIPMEIVVSTFDGIQEAQKHTVLASTACLALACVGVVSFCACISCAPSLWRPAGIDDTPLISTSSEP